MRSLLVALAFLTIFPIRFASIPHEKILSRSRFWYPVVGLLLGLILAGLAWGLNNLPLSTGVKSFLLLGSWVLFTGALHIDGFCDLCDALFVKQSPKQRLAILKDPHLGTFGLVGGVLLLLGKFVLLKALFRENSYLLMGLIIASCRCLVWVVAAGAHYPRAQGTGKVLIEATRHWEVYLFSGLGLMMILPGMFFLSPIGALSLFTVLLLVALIVRWICTVRLGGITGDCLGACIELSEWAGLLALVIIENLPGERGLV